nr:glycoside hydrolase [uncultured Carboxylicivirga sp.]
MAFIKISTCLAFIIALTCSCNSNKKTSTSGANEVLINSNRSFQTMEGFGASDCWTLQFVGKNWPEEKKEAIADLLFSKENDAKGNPKGIGLSQWRFNIGGGTAEQGENSGIPSNWRRAECFLNADGTYNWNKQIGQQWFLKAAQQRGVESLLAFNNTAPVYFTKNGKGWSPGGHQYNLKADKYHDYAQFLVEVCQHFENEGLAFDYISPFNEPQWDWKAPATQEGSPAWNEEIAKLVKELSPVLAQKVPHALIAIPEAAQLQFLYENRGYKNRDNQIKDLFNTASDMSVIDLPNVKKTSMGHSYFTTNIMDTLITVREKLRDYLDNNTKDVNYWQSEFCILEAHEDIGGGHKRDLGMATALYVARVIHADLAIGNASLWSWWTAVSPNDYKDGLVYIDLGPEVKRTETYDEQLQQDGYVYDSKLMWALGNYSRFITPGMVRIDTHLENSPSLKDQMTQLMISGYKTEANNKYVFVAVNYQDKETDLSFNEFMKENDDMTASCYITSDDKNLEKTEIHESDIHIPARSVVTIVFER